MPVRRFDLQSEPYNEFGNISAEGVQRLLGAPKAGRLQTAIRESVQNSWDARLSGTEPRYQLRLRHLTDTQRKYLRDVVFASVPPEGSGLGGLHDYCRESRGLVLEIIDRSTKGLGGPTNPRDEDTGEEAPDFVNFFRNIGNPRDVHHGGGTYGYGKSSLFGLSGCGTILVHTRAHHGGRPVNRMMGAANSHRYQVSSGVARGKFTGRHWWGEFSETGRLEPVRGASAAEHAEALGLPHRGEEDYGTSIMILDPQLDADSLESAGTEIVQTLLWNFWPKMVASGGGARRIHFSAEVDEAELVIPDPAEFPPLHLYVRALRKIREGNDRRTPILLRKPITHLGYLAIERDIWLRRKPPATVPDGLFPDPSAHVALMRPAELVVCYLEGDSLPDRAAEWGGVFVCSDEDEIEQAFADAEPPAHDSWDPASLPKGSRRKSYVNIALERIRDAMREIARPLGKPEEGTESRASLGAAADALGAQLLGVSGDRLGSPPGGTGSGGGGGAGRKPPMPARGSVGRPVFHEHREWEGEACALFAVRVRPPENGELRLRARARVVQEGGDSVDEAPNGKRPHVLGWLDESGDVLGTGEEHAVRGEAVCELFVLVSIPDYVAITLELERA